MNNRKRRARCHTPGKDAYRFQAEAERAAREAAAGYGYEMRAYECEGCRRWHITKVKAKR